MLKAFKKLPCFRSGYKLHLSAKLTQPELAEKAGVGLGFLRDLEQGKPTLRLDKVSTNF